VYGKIFEQIYEGSLRMNWKAMITFQQMIILCDKDGILDMTPDALHFRTGVPLDIIKEGLEILELPDPESRTRSKEGRRIIRLDEHRGWGWQLVNHNYYRDLLNRKDKKERDRSRMAKKRAEGKRNKNKGVADSRQESPGVPVVAHTNTNTDTNTDANTNTQKEEKNKKKKSVACVWPSDFILTDVMKTYAIDKGINPKKVDAFFDDFKNWADQNEKTYKDWTAAFRTRVGKAPEYGKQFLKSKPKAYSDKTQNNIDLLKGG
jgi:hypothetical protein